MTTLTITTLGQKLADPDAVQAWVQESDCTLLCSHCGEVITKENALCTLARCQYEGVEHLLFVSFTDGEEVIGARLWASPSTDLEVVVDMTLELFLDEVGLDLSEWELLHIHKLGEETPEGFTTCTPPVELA